MMTGILVVFGIVYLAMILGEFPGLALDRTGAALLGAVALVALGEVEVAKAWSAVDMPTIYLLFGLMVISAQFRLGGFYGHVTKLMVALPVSPPALLAFVIAAAGLLSAVLTNDIVCLAMAPVMIEGCCERKLSPLPFLLALACASNVGSAATLIGNPQNILIGQNLKLSFSHFLLDAGVPAALGLVAIWAIIAWQYRGKWMGESRPLASKELARFNAWQSGKGIAITTVLIVAFLFFPRIPREVVALTCAGILLLSRRMASRDMLKLVDWQLLVLFIGLFIVNHALQESGAMASALAALQSKGIDPSKPAWLFGLSTLLSNIVSNVPATMLLLPSASHPNAGPILALSSTLAGNLLLVGSIANIIVAEQAKEFGVRIDFRTHAKTGVPVGLVTLGIAACWIWAG